MGKWSQLLGVKSDARTDRWTPIDASQLGHSAGEEVFASTRGNVALLLLSEEAATFEIEQFNTLLSLD